jgi:hypothetical protein
MEEATAAEATYIRPTSGPASSLQPFAGMPAGGFTAGAPAPGSMANVMPVAGYRRVAGGVEGVQEGTGRDEAYNASALAIGSMANA